MPIFNKNIKRNRGMTYIELIVVLSIFSVIAGVSMYNYGSFQGKVDIKNTANDIALKIVQAQKDASFGKIPSTGAPSLTWKPSYGLYFDYNFSNKAFLYFPNLDNDNLFDSIECGTDYNCVEETINMTKGNYISNMSVTGTGTCSPIIVLVVVFTRPGSGATLTSDQAGCTSISSASIKITSLKGNEATIIVDASGRVQIN